jgi:hypothetical protein
MVLKTPGSRWCTYDRRVRRPLPNIPRLRSRFRPAPAPKPLLLGCPRVSPDWELAALQALIRPQVRGPILHRAAEQTMPRYWRQIVKTTSAALREIIGFEPDLHWPTSGDYWFAAQVDPSETTLARATAVVLTRKTLRPRRTVLPPTVRHEAESRPRGQHPSPARPAGDAPKTAVTIDPLTR